MAKKEAVSTSPNMQPAFHMVMTFFVLLIVNAVVIFLAHSMSPQNVVVGNMSLSLLWATALFSGLLSLIVTFVWPFVAEASNQIRREWSPAEMMGIYLVVNLVSVYLITRASHIFGVGVTSWLVVLALAVVFDFLQGIAIVMIDMMRGKK